MAGDGRGACVFACHSVEGIRKKSISDKYFGISLAQWSLYNAPAFSAYVMVNRLIRWHNPCSAILLRRIHKSTRADENRPAKLSVLASCLRRIG
jgi:hypothetical protein